MAGTAKEALLAEALGDLGECLDRLESLKSGLASEADAAAARITAAADNSLRLVRDEGRGMADRAATEQKALLTGLASAARDIRAAAGLVEGKARWFIVCAAVTGFSAGVLGGLAVLLVK